MDKHEKQFLGRILGLGVGTLIAHTMGLKLIERLYNAEDVNVRMVRGLTDIVSEIKEREDAEKEQED